MLLKSQIGTLVFSVLLTCHIQHDNWHNKTQRGAPFTHHWHWARAKSFCLEIWVYNIYYILYTIYEYGCAGRSFFQCDGGDCEKTSIEIWQKCVNCFGDICIIFYITIKWNLLESTVSFAQFRLTGLVHFSRERLDLHIGRAQRAPDFYPNWSNWSNWYKCVYMYHCRDWFLYLTI